MSVDLELRKSTHVTEYMIEFNPTQTTPNARCAFPQQKLSCDRAPLPPARPRQLPMAVRCSSEPSAEATGQSEQDLAAVIADSRLPLEF